MKALNLTRLGCKLSRIISSYKMVLKELKKKVARKEATFNSKCSWSFLAIQKQLATWRTLLLCKNFKWSKLTRKWCRFICKIRKLRRLFRLCLGWTSGEKRTLDLDGRISRLRPMTTCKKSPRFNPNPNLKASQKLTPNKNLSLILQLKKKKT